jgi:hypothetical protein
MRALICGAGLLPTRVAGEVADGFLCHGFTTSRWIRERTLPALRAGRERAGVHDPTRPSAVILPVRAGS